ncbi:MAG: hypothetical protein F6K30_10985 [Cyanothece sp. SIO2G6]|nr:hypothetical protein [Cyanothece sp. SIO2G6]
MWRPLYYIRDFSLFHQKRHPREIGVDEIRAYLSYLSISGVDTLY